MTWLTRPVLQRLRVGRAQHHGRGSRRHQQPGRQRGPEPATAGEVFRAPRSLQVVVQVRLVGGSFAPFVVAMNPKVVEPPAGSAPL